MKFIYRHILAATALLGSMAVNAEAAFESRNDDKRSEKEIDEKLDLTVTKFRKDGTAGNVFEFNSMSIPNVRCVVFSFGGAGGMQCFPRPPKP